MGRNLEFVPQVLYVFPGNGVEFFRISEGSKTGHQYGSHTPRPTPHFTLQTEKGPSESGKMEGGCWERVWTGMVKHEYARPHVTAL